MRQLTDAELAEMEAGAPDPRKAERDAAWERHRAELEADGLDAESIRRVRLSLILAEMDALGQQMPAIGAVLESTGVTAIHRRRQS